MRQHAIGHSDVERLCLSNAQNSEVNLTQQDVVMLLIGKPGHLRNALQTLVCVAPGLDRLITADTGLLALKVMRQVRPTLVLVTSDLAEAEIVELLRQIKEEWPKTGCLVLTDSAQGRRQSLAAGADCVLSAGLSAGQLFSAIQHVLEDSSEPK
jgi:DNA-binding NarL/FixJ family response regulator